VAALSRCRVERFLGCIRVGLQGMIQVVAILHAVARVHLRVLPEGVR
jgi:hypothetical protein